MTDNESIDNQDDSIEIEKLQISFTALMAMIIGLSIVNPALFERRL